MTDTPNPPAEIPDVPIIEWIEAEKRHLNSFLAYWREKQTAASMREFPERGPAEEWLNRYKWFCDTRP